MANDKYFYYWGPAIKPTREERTADDFGAAALLWLFELFCRAADAVWIPLHRRKLAVDIADVQSRADSQRHRCQSRSLELNTPASRMIALVVQR